VKEEVEKRKEQEKEKKKGFNASLFLALKWMET
jgi:hypothetical protein